MTVKPSFNIVLVEDEQALGEICQELMSKNGFSTTLYSSASAVLNEQIVPNMDLLITDVGLAGSSGYDLAKELNLRLEKANKAKVPVIFISGAEFSGIDQLQSENTYFLEKPFTFKMLLGQVKTVIEKQNKSHKIAL